MPTDDEKLKDQADLLKQEIAHLKSDTRELQGFLRTVEITESEADDEKEIQTLDQQLANLN